MFTVSMDGLKLVQLALFAGLMLPLNGTLSFLPWLLWLKESGNGLKTHFRLSLQWHFVRVLALCNDVGLSLAACKPSISFFNGLFLERMVGQLA